MIMLLTGMQNIPGESLRGGADRRRQRLRAFPAHHAAAAHARRSSSAAIIGMLNSFSSFDLVYVMTAGGPGHATEILVTYIYKLGVQAGAIRLCRRADGRAVPCAADQRDLARQPAGRRQCGRGGERRVKRYPRWPIHLALLAVSFVMLVPFYWVLKTSRLRREHLRLSADHHPARSQPVLLRRCLVRDSVSRGSC